MMSHLKSCTRCGRIHPFNFRCNKGWEFVGGIERKLRNKYAWERKSKEIRESAGWLCEVCRRDGRYSYSNLSTHHITRVRDDPDRYLDNYNLICLCRECHQKAEDGTLDSSFLFDIAKEREEGS